LPISWTLFLHIERCFIYYIGHVIRHTAESARGRPVWQAGIPVMKTMKALVKSHRQPGLSLQDIPVPAIGINDVLLRVHKTGICGTDLHIYKWDAWAQKTIPVPMTVGHEFVGEVVEIGSNVKDFKRGD